MKILLLGKGYIGNYLANFATTSFNVLHFSKQDLDYSNPNVFRDFLEKESPSWIINASGYTGKPNVDACEKDKDRCYTYNVDVPFVLTKIANDVDIPIIHIGSGCVYSGYEKTYTEEDAPNFGLEQTNSSFYSKTKDSFEKFTDTLKRYIFRIRIPFNGVPEPKNYLWKLLHYDNLISKQNSITNVDDLIHFVYKFITEKREPGIYNVVNDGSISAQDIVFKLMKNKLTNKNWKFVTVEEANFEVERSNCILSTEKIKNINLGLPSIEESVDKAIFQYKLFLNYGHVR